MKKSYICKLCGKEIKKNNNSHNYMCQKIPDDVISRSDRKFYYYLQVYPQFDSREKLYDLYINKLYSLPDFKREFDIPYSVILYLLQKFCIQKRTLKQSSTLIIVNKNIKHHMQLYGTTNALSKGSPGYQKRNETVQQKYGVDNVFQIQSIKQLIHSDEFWIERHGKTKSQMASIYGKKVWADKTEQQRQQWLYKSIWKNGISSIISKLELCVATILNRYDIKYVQQYMVNGYFCDFYLPQYDLIIQVNGDYWHANPEKYKQCDVIKYPGGIFLTAKCRWKKQKIRMNSIKRNGYAVLVLWQNKINTSNDQQIYEIIKNKMDESYVKKNKKYQED